MRAKGMIVHFVGVILWFHLLEAADAVEKEPRSHENDERLCSRDLVVQFLLTVPTNKE